MMARRQIREQWIKETILYPQFTEPDPKNPRALRAWIEIPERNFLALRVVYDHTIEPYFVITTFFDRSMKGKL